MINFVLRFVSTLAGLKCAEILVPDFRLKGGFTVLLIAAGMLGILNWLIKPALVYFSVPLLVWTSGVFYFVVNVLVIYTASLLFPDHVFGSMLGILLASVIISGFHWILTFCLRIKKHE